MKSDVLNNWIENNNYVALYLRQELQPVETIDADEDGYKGIIYPPTYADIGYNVDSLPDGRKVVTIDSVGSQANRMEPLFASESEDRERWLVPQISIVLRTDPTPVKQSILDLAHRAADAVVQASPGLLEPINSAFDALQGGDAWPLCALAPTSLVFGVWDSRGGTGEKRPRLVRSMIRAWDVEILHSAAQFNSVWKSLHETDQEALRKEEKQKNREKRSVVGLADTPAIFRNSDKVPEYKNGAPNPDRRVLGGVLVKGKIVREVTLNLVALRALRGKTPDETTAIRKYLFGLSLMAATNECELFLREGCNLRYADEADIWHQVPRRGDPDEIDLPFDANSLRDFTLSSAKPFREKWPENTEYKFDLNKAKQLLIKKKEDEDSQSG